MDSRTANVGFILGSWSGIITSVVVTVLALAVSPRAFNASEMYGGKSAFLVLFVFVAMLIALQWYLWLSMLWFLLTRARLKFGLRLAWFLAVFFGLAFGAALFYLFSWRAAHCAEDVNTDG